MASRNPTRDLTVPSKDDVTVALLSAFKKLISDGVLVPGCKLPAERTLSKTFGISRGSLRQALKVLQIMGVLTQRVGDGTYLSSNAQHILSEPLNFLVLLGGISHHELFEARLIVEPELAARAAERANAEDLAALKREIKRLDRSKAWSSEAVEADLAFHEAIFRSAGNRVCQLMFSVIHRALITSIAQNNRRADTKHTLSLHNPIYDAIFRRDPETARKRMIEHLKEAMVLLLQPESKPAVVSIGHLAPIESASMKSAEAALKRKASKRGWRQL